MGSNWKKKGGKKAKSKKKAKKKLEESSEKSDEFRPFTEAEQRLLDAWAKDDKLMRSTEDDFDIVADSDEAYMLVLTESTSISEETMRLLHEAKSERFKYFIEYGMFEEEWVQLKKKYPDEFVGELLYMYCTFLCCCKLFIVSLSDLIILARVLIIIYMVVRLSY